MEQRTEIARIKQPSVPKKRGRKPLLEVRPEIKDIIIEDIRKGGPIEVACVKAGISERTFYLCQERAEEGRSPYVEFFQELKRASAEAEINAAHRLFNATGNQGIAPAIWLERAKRERWSRSDKVADVSVPVTVVVQNFAGQSNQSATGKVTTP